MIAPEMTQTSIYILTSDGENKIGYVDADGAIHAQYRGGGSRLGRVDSSGRVFRYTTYDERELGLFTADGQVHSHGLFEGGALGWVDPDGVVVRAGLILGEEEVGRVVGPHPHAAGAALLLLFLPDGAESTRRVRN